MFGDACASGTRTPKTRNAQGMHPANRLSMASPLGRGRPDSSKDAMGAPTTSVPPPSDIPHLAVVGVEVRLLALFHPLHAILRVDMQEEAVASGALDDAVRPATVLADVQKDPRHDPYRRLRVRPAGPDIRRPSRPR